MFWWLDIIGAPKLWRKYVETLVFVVDSEQWVLGKYPGFMLLTNIVQVVSVSDTLANGLKSTAVSLHILCMILCFKIGGFCNLPLFWYSFVPNPGVQMCISIYYKSTWFTCIVDSAQNLIIFSLVFFRKPTGPHKIEYDRDTPSRRKKRNDRRKSLVQKAYELSEICGGDVFLRYIDEHNKEWAYSNREETWNEYVRNGLQPTGNLLRCDNTGRCCSNIHFVPPSGSVQQNTPPVQLPAENPYYVMKKEVAEQSEDSETESSDGSDEELSEASALASRQALANSSFTPLTQTVTSQIINHPGMSPGNASFASPNKQYFIANGDTLVPMNPTQGVSIVEYPLFNPITVKGQKRKFVEQPVWLGRPNVPVLQYVRPGAQPMMSEQTKKRDKKKKKSGGKVCCNFRISPLVNPLHLPHFKYKWLMLI